MCVYNIDVFIHNTKYNTHQQSTRHLDKQGRLSFTTTFWRESESGPNGSWNQFIPSSSWVLDGGGWPWMVVDGRGSPEELTCRFHRFHRASVGWGLLAPGGSSGGTLCMAMLCHAIFICVTCLRWLEVLGPSRNESQLWKNHRSYVLIKSIGPSVDRSIAVKCCEISPCPPNPRGPQLRPEHLAARGEAPRAAQSPCGDGDCDRRSSLKWCENNTV